MKKLSAVLVFVITLVSLTGYAFAWSGQVEGKPDVFRPGDARGYFVWHNNDGFHLRTTTKGQEHVFTGVIRTNGNFVDVDDVRTEHNDRMRVSRDRDTITFRFVTDGGVDGLDFRIRGGGYAHFELYMDGHRINHREIYLGDNGRHPRHSEFTIHR